MPTTAAPPASRPLDPAGSLERIAGRKAATTLRGAGTSTSMRGERTECGHDLCAESVRIVPRRLQLSMGGATLVESVDREADVLNLVQTGDGPPLEWRNLPSLPAPFGVRTVRRTELSTVPLPRLGRQSSSQLTRPDACLSGTTSRWRCSGGSVSARPTGRKPAVLAARSLSVAHAGVTRKALPPASVLGYSPGADRERRRREPLQDPGAKTALSAETPGAAHPCGETAKLRTGLLEP